LHAASKQYLYNQNRNFMRNSLFVVLVMFFSYVAKSQTYTWTNRTSTKIKVNFEYNLPIGPNSNMLLSKEFNPGESFTYNNGSGLITQAKIFSGGLWNGKFGILYMGTCATCYSAGNYDILTTAAPPSRPPTQPPAPTYTPEHPAPAPPPPPGITGLPNQVTEKVEPGETLLLTAYFKSGGHCVVTIYNDITGNLVGSWNGESGQLQQSYKITNPSTRDQDYYRFRVVVAVLHDGIWVNDTHNITPYNLDCAQKLSEVNELYRYVDLKFLITNPKSCRGSRFGTK
jgi:hypothetical protein